MNFDPSQDIKINKSYQKTNKKGKKIKSLLIFLLFVLVGLCVAYSYYAKNGKNNNLRNEFFEKIVNNELAFFADNELYENVAQKLEEGKYNSVANINLSTNMENNMLSELDLSKFEFVYDYTKDKSDDKSYGKITTKYSGNDVITLQGIQEGEKIAVKSDEIVNKYVGLNSENAENIAEKILETEVELTSAKLLNNFLFDREWVNVGNIASSAGLKDYAEIFKNNTSIENFSKKENVVVTLNQEQVTTTEYTVNLSSDQVGKMFEQILKKLDSDDKLLSELVVSNVEDFENEDTGIIDYTDNDNTVEISGENNNFNASINIWGNSTQEENIVTNEAVTENNTVPNNTVDNNVSDNNMTQNSTVAQNVANEAANNTVINQQPVQDQTNTTEVENVAQEPAVQETENTPEQPAEDAGTENSVNEATNTLIEEEENLRTQGFIEVNEGVQIDDENPFVIGEDYEETIKNIAQISENIDWQTYLLTGAKANCSQEQLSAFLQEFILNSVGQNTSLIVKIYVSQNQTVKLNFEFPEAEKSFDIEIVSISDNEKYLNIKVLNGQEAESNGYTVSLYKKQTDAGIKSKININKVYKSKISQKLNINSETKGSLSSKKYTNNIEVLYSDSGGEIEAQINDVLNFDVTPEIEDLNNENCLFIDEISDEELKLTRDAIAQKTREVLSEKNRNLNMVSAGNSVVEQIMPNQQSQDNTQKQEVKQVLINTLSDKMREYQDSGSQLKLEDLRDLQIPGYEVGISISSNLAIITVNGYSFKLDSDFNLSDS